MFFFCFSIQTEPKLLPQVEEVTYAEPVLLPQASSQNKIQHSPKSTLRKPMGHHHGVNSETLFQVILFLIFFFFYSFYPFWAWVLVIL